MGLGQALTSAVSGLRVTQSSLSIVSGNISNAETPGYVRKSVTQVAAASANITIGVRLSAVNRELDTYLQAQLRTESSGGTYAGTLADYYARLQAVFGQPGASNALATKLNDLTGAAQTLSTSPDSSSARFGVLTAGQSLAQHLNGMTADIQGLRSQAELELEATVAQANEAMQQIASINHQLGQSNLQDATAAVLRDQRDAAVDRLSQLMNIKVVGTDNNKISIFSGAGTQLVGDQAVTLKFDAKGSLGATSLWNADPTKRGVGTITIDNGNDGGFDLVANGVIKSGTIAGLLQMRDQVLVAAQAQVDQVAAQMSSALSDRTVTGAAVSSNGQTGYEVDIGSLLAGNTIRINYTDGTGTKRDVTIMRVDDPRVLPLPASTTANPNDRVVGVDFSGGIASTLAQIQSALGSTGMRFSIPTGTVLRVLDDGNGGQIDVNSLSATSTMTSLTGGTSELPFFLDGSIPYSGAVTPYGRQSTGLAGRIAINPALLADPTRLVVYQTSPLTDVADAKRPNFLLNALTGKVLDFAPQAGVGTVAAPFSGTLSSYVQQMLSQQGEAAANADSLNQGQQIVVNSLQQKFTAESGVSIDAEMASLLQLQTAYGANARVLSTIKDMINMLLQL
jgi:flagellar hook-associated protein 1 FlgK